MKTIILASILAVAAVPAFAQSGHSMSGHGDGHMAQKQPAVAGSGTVDAVRADARQVKVTHAPIKALGWPAMTMDFAVADGIDLSRVKAGDRIDFELARGGDGIYMITGLTRK
ncbi:copper-binding protein [Magnetospirillum sp. UT-4]|uniref:copper-binding protein n=1 Tax=Magnetospirillum sp. UT-4 TaxID=2681467 RepID=UPI00137D845A|nr:copper-binding protein [Magnetospirillum sp. UT-4]CAA7614943.1 Cation efflux system protein [Magnetospirillum sp. UT-4]